MFFFNLFAHTASRKPVILVPGTYASILQAKATNVPLQWYCPKDFDWKTIWLDEAYFVPPRYNCLLKWLSVEYDEKTKSTKNLDGLEIDTLNFGSLDGVSMVDKFSILNVSFIPYYFELIKVMKNDGYVEGETLYGAPNDWRLGIAGLNATFTQRMKELVEKAYAKTGEKVVIVGHSFGSFISHFFETAMEQEWVDKYIDHVVLLAPSFSGAGETIGISWTRAIKIGIKLNLTGTRALLENIGAVHTHYPNYELHADEPIMYLPDGKEVYPKDFITLLHQTGRLSDENEKIARLQEPFISKAPPRPKARTIIAFNSAVKTTTSINLKSMDEGADYTSNYAGGDGTILSSGINKYCKMYPEIECHDFNETKNGSHFLMLMNPKLVNYFYELIKA